jgi:hypothetical protein
MLISDLFSAAAGRSSRAVQLFWWQGWSTRWYVTSVYDIKDFRCREAGMFVVVRKEGDGTRTPLLVGAADDVTDALFNECGDPFLRAIRAGATEIHVHLASEGAARREAAARDVADGWQMSVHHPLVYA